MGEKNFQSSLLIVQLGRIALFQSFDSFFSSIESRLLPEELLFGPPLFGPPLCMSVIGFCIILIVPSGFSIIHALSISWSLLSMSFSSSNQSSFIILSSSCSFKSLIPLPNSSSLFKFSMSPRLNYRPMLSKSYSMPINSQSDTLLERKLMISLIVCLFPCLRARTMSRFIFSAFALFYSAIQCSFRRYSAYSRFCSLDNNLLRIPSLSSSRRFSTAFLYSSQF